MRGKYQREQFLNKINNLSPRQAGMVANYMMKLLFQKLFEPQKDWFAKKGVSLHGSMLANYLQNFKTSIVNLMTNKIGIFLQAALRNQSRTLKNFILKCLPSLCGLTMEPTTKILHFCYHCLTFLHLQWYRFLVSEILSPRKASSVVSLHVPKDFALMHYKPDHIFPDSGQLRHQQHLDKALPTKWVSTSSVQAL